MTLSETSPAQSPPGPDAAVEYLLRDRAWGAYPLGYVDPTSDVAATLYPMADAGNITALVMLAQLPQLASIYATGDPSGVNTILGGMPNIPASGVFSVRAEVLVSLERHFHVSTSYQMRRMKADAGSLRPRHDARVSRLGVDDLDAVRRLYGMWTDAHQLPGQLARGVYFGVYRGRDLVSIAGTHCISPSYHVGAIGNVLTHSSFRNRGLASVATTAVAEELFRMGCEEVVLNVRQGNDAGMATYRRLGFTAHNTFIEGVFHARAGGR